jgi:hypothetical protein
MSANSFFQDDVQTNTNDDGTLKTNYLMVFKPLNKTGNGPLEVYVTSTCSSPMATTSCDSTSASATFTTYTTSSSGQCLDAIAGTLHPYNPAITYSTAPCFVTGTFDLTLTIAGILVHLHDVNISGTFTGEPVTAISNGLLRGFMYETDANASILPSTLPLIGGKPLSAILAGGSGCCASTSDMDTLNGVKGWWLYMNFTAPQVPYIGN